MARKTKNPNVCTLGVSAAAYDAISKAAAREGITRKAYVERLIAAIVSGRPIGA